MRTGCYMVLASVLLAGCRTIIDPRNRNGLPPKAVVLTFDDGPNTNHNVTARLLDVLAAHNVNACFCLPGVEVTKSPALVRRIAAEGHIIVNHTHSHRPVVSKSRNWIRREIERCDSAIGKVLGRDDYRSRYFRPPGGIVTGGLLDVLDERGMVLLPLTFYAFDSHHGPATADGVIEDTRLGIRKHNGGIIVFHDGRLWPRNQTPEMLTSPRNKVNRTWIPMAVDVLISDLKRDGFRLGPLEQHLSHLQSGPRARDPL